MTNRRTKAKKVPVTITLKNLGLKLKYPAPRARKPAQKTAKKLRKQEILLPPTLTSKDYPLLTEMSKTSKKESEDNTTNAREYALELYDEVPIDGAESDTEENKPTTKPTTNMAMKKTSENKQPTQEKPKGFGQQLLESTSTFAKSMKTTEAKGHPKPATTPTTTNSTQATTTPATKTSNATNGSETKSIYRLSDEQKVRETKVLQEEAKKEKDLEKLKASLKEKNALLKGQASTLEQKQELLAEKNARIALLEEQIQRKNAEPTPVPFPASENATPKKEEHMSVDHNVTDKSLQKTTNSNSSNFERRPHFSKSKHDAGERTHKHRSASANAGNARSSSKESERQEHEHTHRERSYSRDRSRDRSPTHRTHYDRDRDNSNKEKEYRQPSRSYNHYERESRSRETSSAYRGEEKRRDDDRRAQDHKPRPQEGVKKNDIVSTPAPPSETSHTEDELKRLLALYLQKELKDKCEKEGTPMPPVAPRTPRSNSVTNSSSPSKNSTTTTVDVHSNGTSTDGRTMNIHELSNAKTLMDGSQTLTRLVTLIDNKYTTDSGREKPDSPPTGFVGSGIDSDHVNTKNAMVYIRELAEYMMRLQKKITALGTITREEANKSIAQNLLTSLEEQRVALAKKNPVRGNTRLQIQSLLVEVRKITGQKSITECNPEEILAILTEEYITDSTVDNAIAALQNTIQEDNELMSVFFSRFCTKLQEVRDAGPSQYDNEHTCVKLFFKGMARNYHRNQLQAQSSITNIASLHEALKTFMRNETIQQCTDDLSQKQPTKSTTTNSAPRQMSQRLSAAAPTNTQVQQATPHQQQRSQEFINEKAERRKSFSVYAHRWLTQKKNGCTRCLDKGHSARFCSLPKQEKTLLTMRDLQNGYNEALHDTYVDDFYKFKENGESPPEEYIPLSAGKRQYQEEGNQDFNRQHKSPRHDNSISTIPSRLETTTGTTQRIRPATSGGGYETTTAKKF